MMMLSLLVALSSVRADVAPIDPAGMQFVTHTLRVEGMDAHTDYVLLVYDAPRNDRIRANLAFQAGGNAEELLSEGQQTRGNRYSKPGFYLMDRKTYDAWSSSTAETVNRQRTACAERGEGCAHISRFVPSYAPPKDAIDCNFHIDVFTQNAKGEPSTIVDVIKLKTATETSCVLEKVDFGAPVEPDEAPTEPDNQPAEDRSAAPVAEDSNGCSAIHGLAAGVWLSSVALLMITRRRRHR